MIRSLIVSELYEHNALMAAAKEKYPGKPICPDCYMPTGMHRTKAGTACELLLVDALSTAGLGGK